MHVAVAVAVVMMMTADASQDRPLGLCGIPDIAVWALLSSSGHHDTSSGTACGSPLMIFELGVAKSRGPYN